MAAISTHYALPRQSSSSPAQASPSFSKAAGEARVAYFLTRSNGLPVPLVPADELPLNINLRSVPRVLTPDQTYGLHYVGNTQTTPATFSLETGSFGMQRSTSQPGMDRSHSRYQSTDSTKQFHAPDAFVRQALATGTALPNRQVSTTPPANNSWRRPSPAPTSGATPTALDAILRSEAGAEMADRIGYRSRDTTPPPSGIVPDQDKKEYCTHWIMHNECAYTQQGCRYKHEVPDKATLAKIGINHVPTWYKEQMSPFKNGAIGIGKTVAAAPPLKSDDLNWLRGRQASDADSERSSLSSKSQSEKKDAKKSPASKSVTTPEKQPIEPPEKTSNSKQSPSSATSESTKASNKKSSPKTTPTRGSPATQARKLSNRKQSNASDLIDFAPLKPEVAASKSANSSPASDTIKVFVPAGEAPDTHIADAKKRSNSSRTPSPSSKNTQQKASPETGLKGSRWASSKPAEGGKRSPKSVCRPRRPASSSPTLMEVKAKASAAAAEKK